MTNRKLIAFGIKFLISILVLWAVYAYLGSPETLNRLKTADPVWIGAGAVCIVLVQVVKSWRFQALGRVLSIQLPFRKCLLAHLIVPILGFVTPGKLGEGAKIFYLGASKKELAFLFIIERFQDMLLLLAVAGFGFAFSNFYLISYLVLVAVILVAIGIFLKLDWVINTITRFVLKKHIFTENWFADQSRRLLHPAFAASSSITLAVWAVTFCSSFCFARSVGVTLSYPNIALVFSWAVILGLISSLPGGVGVREGGITVLFDTIYGIPRAVGMAVAAVNLAVHYIVLTITAIIGYAVYRSGQEKTSI
ncbi:flippase-like domain-containing protein [bacterium]|nr:flippase-like domain-containing protein [candidate division CSSED10-310 bacterium]